MRLMRKLFVGGLLVSGMLMLAIGCGITPSSEYADLEGMSKGAGFDSSTEKTTSKYPEFRSEKDVEIEQLLKLQDHTRVYIGKKGEVGYYEGVVYSHALYLGTIVKDSSGEERFFHGVFEGKTFLPGVFEADNYKNMVFTPGVFFGSSFVPGFGKDKRFGSSIEEGEFMPGIFREVSKYSKLSTPNEFEFFSGIQNFSDAYRTIGECVPAKTIDKGSITDPGMVVKPGMFVETDTFLDRDRFSYTYLSWNTDLGGIVPYDLPVVIREYRIEKAPWEYDVIHPEWFAESILNKPDLVPRNFVAPSYALSGEPIGSSMALDVQNYARCFADEDSDLNIALKDGYITVGFYLSDDTEFDDEDVLLDNGEVNVAAQFGWFQTKEVPINSDMAIPENIELKDGLYYLLAVVDVYDEVEESFELNNVAAHLIKFWRVMGSADWGFNVDDVSLFIYDDGTFRGIPYVAMVDFMAQNYGVVYKFDGAYWEKVGSSVFSNDRVNDISLYVYDGTPYVAYGKRDWDQPYKAVVKKYNGTIWETVGVARFSEDEVWGISLFVDNGTPYVSYSDKANSDKATVMKYNGTNWVTVGEAGFSDGAVSDTSLFVYNGTPYVAYSDQSHDGKAVLMMFSGNEWINVDRDGLAPGFSAGGAGYVSLYIASGVPYVAYRDMENNGKVSVVKWNGIFWSYVGADGFGLSAGDAHHISLFLSFGKPYVAYQDMANDRKATVMTFDGYEWVSVGNPGFSDGDASQTSLFVHNGIPYVAFKDGSGDNKGVTVMKFE